jgi:hypothetical protein
LISLSTMTVLESQFEQVANAIDAREVLHFEYDLKFEVVLLKEVTIQYNINIYFKVFSFRYSYWKRRSSA